MTAAPPGPAADCAALVNRVLKNARHLARWARREDLEAYRVYDRDIPEFPYAVDRYGAWLCVQLFEGKRPLAEQEVVAHLDALGAALEVERARVALKVRRRQRGAAQYEKLTADGPSFTVRERGHLFEVNLLRYLDTGLFLDHRETRALVASEARERRVLNLFAYTGSFTVYVAKAGAAASVTVDMSHTYQAWTARNLALNGLTDDARHRLVTADVNTWLEEQAWRRERFDLIVLDDLSYVRKDQAETSVLFELISARYERRSIMITANQPFSGWDSIFLDKAMTVAAIDRLVHHATILEMNVESYRRRSALASATSLRDSAPDPATSPSDIETMPATSLRDNAS